MLRLPYAIRTAFGSRHGRTVFIANMLAAGGVLCGGLQVIGQMYPSLLHPPMLVLGGTATMCLVWATLRTYPRPVVRQEFTNPDFMVVVEVGDLFDQDVHLVVGFTDVYDTATDDDLVISTRSVQGQLLDRCYDGDHDRLDRELSAALRRVTPVARESRIVKDRGKLVRYPLGTTAVLRNRDRQIFAVAYGRMNGTCVAESTPDELWFSLNRLWEAIYQHGGRRPVAMPLVGSGLARIDVLDPQSLLKLILLSFVAQCRHRVVCRELRVIVHPTHLPKINMLAIASFLQDL